MFSFFRVCLNLHAGFITRRPHIPLSGIAPPESLAKNVKRKSIVPASHPNTNERSISSSVSDLGSSTGYSSWGLFVDRRLHLTVCARFAINRACANAPISDTIKTSEPDFSCRIMTSKLSIHGTISADRASVSFVAFSREQAIQCNITRKALEQCFWVPAGASDERLLKALNDGYERISARVHRKFLAHPSSSVHLDVMDFAS